MAESGNYGFGGLENIAPVTQAEFEEHAHIDGTQATPGGKQVHLLGLGTTRGGLLSLASAGIAQKIPATALTNRKSLILYNSSASTIWIGASSLASGNGIPIDAGEKIAIDSFDNVFLCPLYAGQVVNYLELS